MVLYIRSVTLRLKRDRVDDFKRIAETEILSVASEANGLSGRSPLRSARAAQGLSNRFWDTKEAHNAFEKTAYQLAKTDLQCGF
jgi:hypothetical protein